jgi:LmbE family N-acetylglucosaminyl deacetylase
LTSNLEGLYGNAGDGDLPGPRRALVVAAHPDDADFGAAGTAYLWTRAGWEFYYLVCTDGSKGSDDATITPAELIERRRQEQRDAARYLGVKDVIFLDHVDGELVGGRALLGDIVRVVREVRPDAVFTHDPEAVIVADAFINHSDHRATGLAAIDAVYPAARDRLNFPEQIAAGLEPHKVREVYIWGSERANFEVDITEAFQVKIDALLLHRSQFSGDDFIKRVMERWRNPDGRYIESFRRVQMSI